MGLGKKDLLFLWGASFYLRERLEVVEINPRMAPTSTNVPPRFPAIMPNINRTIAQVRVETNLEPAMHTTPSAI